jgi:uncharacterized protein YbjT (DUF2867 family)
MQSKLILVTGATGYIAGRLIPQLLERGYTVRALARNPQCLRSRKWHDRVEVVQGNVMDPKSLAAALKDVHTAYYLIHNMSLGVGYTKLETQSARAFSLAAEEAGVQHIIYLGGLADKNQPISPHLLSRIETGSTLRQGKVPVTEFRASVIAGSGSTSFEMIRFMTELFPIVPIPRWMQNKSQPIAVQNILDYLLAALEKWDGNRALDIGGPDIITYQELIQIYANARGHKCGFLSLPYIPVRVMAFGIGLMSPVPYVIARALVRGLAHDSVVISNEARELYPEIIPMNFESAVRQALEHLHPLKVERVWEAEIADPDESCLCAEVYKHEGFFIKYSKVKINARPETVFDVISKMAEGFGSQRFIVDTVEPNNLLLLHSKMNIPGEGWLEWRVEPHGDATALTQTIFFAPCGLPGFVHWHLLYPLHMLEFRSFIRKIKRSCSA